MAKGIKDKVVILGMGCSVFGERWDMDSEDLMMEAFEECIADAGIEKNQLDAAWMSTAMIEVNTGKSALPMSIGLRLPNIPVTRVEGYCVSGTEAFRGAVYAVASGAADFALALGVEKLKDTGFGGLPEFSRGIGQDLMGAVNSPPGSFAQLASAYQARHGVDWTDLKRAMGWTAVKSHANAVNNPKAHLRKKIDLETVVNAPMVADPLGLFDCCGVSDGAACAIVTRPELARELGKDNLVGVKAVQLAASNGVEGGHNSWDGSHFMTTRIAAERAYKEAGIDKPRDAISMFDVHDCFSITELVTMEDLFLSDDGEGWKDILDGRYDADGQIPCQIDGGLKCFGHPIGASGLRMIYEMYLQFLGRAEERQIADPRFGLTQNLGGYPHQNISSVTILGCHGD